MKKMLRKHSNISRYCHNVEPLQELSVTIGNGIQDNQM